MFYIKIPCSFLPDDHDKRMSVIEDLAERSRLPEWCMSEDDKENIKIIEE